jgi:two-component system nitrogen regulation sensor histidine kinase NtrY
MAIFLFLGGATYICLVSEALNQSKLLILGLTCLDFCVLYIAIGAIARKIYRLLKISKKQWGGHKLHKQIIIIFSTMTAVPALCVFTFAVLFLNTGIDALFKTPVKIAMDSAGQVANIYISHMKWAMEDFLSGLGTSLAEIIQDRVIIDKNLVEDILIGYTSGLDIDAMVFQLIDEEKFIIATSSFVLSLQFSEIPKEIFEEPTNAARSFEQDQFVFAVKEVDRSKGLYVIAKRNISSAILDHKYKIKSAVSEYTKLAVHRSGIKITFVAFFSSIVVLLLLISIFVGVFFANRIIVPINKLIVGAKQISRGNYDIVINSKRFKNEIDLLISSFNVMLQQLTKQREELIIFHKQTAWRDIARKIAHEIKNPLTPIMLAANRLKNKYSSKISEDDTHIFTSCLDTIVRQVSCIENLVSEFSKFARMPAPTLARCDIIKIIEDVVFIHASANQNIKFHKALSVDQFFCTIDPDQINQVLMNILQNAINAINETSGSTSKSGDVYISFSNQNESFRIFIEDNGPGFPTGAIEHAFDPYYTTRKKGNGLGLSIVYRIITEHSGVINLSKSNTHDGAAVSIELPSTPRLN